MNAAGVANNIAESSIPGDGGAAEGMAPVKDRLTTTLFLAALFHGIVIIGISFAIPAPPIPAPAPTLEVVLLAQEGLPGADRPQAQYLAQRNQAGGGTIETPVKMTAPPSSPLAEPQVGLPDGSGIDNRKTLSGAPEDDLLRAHNSQAPAADSGETNPAEEEETPLAMLPAAPSPILATSPEDALRLQGNASRSLIVTPDTRASKVAPYLGAWKRKIERIGTVNYPNEARRKDMTGSPVLEVTIRADGSLARINVRRSSGHKEIDQAALAILRLAAPFDPFPAALKRDYDELHFAYEWQFVGNGLGSGTLRVDNANSGTD